MPTYSYVSSQTNAMRQHNEINRQKMLRIETSPASKYSLIIKDWEALRHEITFDLLVNRI